eukprot:g28379.t1
MRSGRFEMQSGEGIVRPRSDERKPGHLFIVLYFSDGECETVECPLLFEALKPVNVLLLTVLSAIHFNCHLECISHTLCSTVTCLVLKSPYGVGGMFSRSGNGLNAGLFKKTQSDQWNHFPTWAVEHPVVDHATVQVIKTTWQQLKSGECQGYQIFKKTGYRAFGNQGSTRQNTRGNTQKTHTVRTSTIHNHHVRGETKSLQTNMSLVKKSGVSSVHSAPGRTAISQSTYMGAVELAPSSQREEECARLTSELAQEFQRIVAKEGLTLNPKLFELTLEAMEKSSRSNNAEIKDINKRQSSASDLRKSQASPRGPGDQPRDSVNIHVPPGSKGSFALVAEITPPVAGRRLIRNGDDVSPVIAARALNNSRAKEVTPPVAGRRLDTVPVAFDMAPRPPTLDVTTRLALGIGRRLEKSNTMDMAADMAKEMQSTERAVLKRGGSAPEIETGQSTGGTVVYKSFLEKQEALLLLTQPPSARLLDLADSDEETDEDARNTLPVSPPALELEHIQEHSMEAAAAVGPPASPKAELEKQIGEAGEDMSNSSISPVQFFYDNFYMHLFALNPKYRLWFSDNIAQQGKMLAQVVGFIVHNCDQMDTHEFRKQTFNLVKVHNHRGVRAEDYDILGQALLMSIKASFGNEYTDSIKRAWTTVYSALLIAVLPFVDGTTHVYIRRGAKWDPTQCMSPSIRKSVSGKGRARRSKSGQDSDDCCTIS